MRPVHGKTQADIAAEWDRIALKRAAQIESGLDLSFRFVLVPSVLSLTADCDCTTVIDLGCGSGFLSAELASAATAVIGVDISPENIRYAAKRWQEIPNVDFETVSIEEYAARPDRLSFSLGVANMTLMTVLDLDGVMKSVARVIRPGGHLIATITHPCYWPVYWGYAEKSWFSYSREIAIEDRFKISLDSGDGCITTHVHRPLERYFASISRAGFLVDEVREPMPTEEVGRRYPKPWQYPRFLAFRAIRK